jgi:hypothetical protein
VPLHVLKRELIAKRKHFAVDEVTVLVILILDGEVVAQGNNVLS